MLLGFWRTVESGSDVDVKKYRADLASSYQYAVTQYGYAVQVEQRKMLEILGVRADSMPVFRAVYPRANVSPLDVVDRAVRDAKRARARGEDPLTVFEERISRTARLDLRAVESNTVLDMQEWLIENGFADEPPESQEFVEGAILPPSVGVGDYVPESAVASEEKIQEFVNQNSYAAAWLGVGEGEPERVTSERDETRGKDRVLPKTPTRIKGWMRVIRPELSATGSCGLCVVAATQFYTLRALSAIHDRCKCIVMPFTRQNNPALALNQADLLEIYSYAGSNQGLDLKRTRVRLTEHSELGQILTYKRKEWVEEERKPTMRRYEKRYERPREKPDMSREIRELEKMRRLLARDKTLPRRVLHDLDQTIARLRAGQ